MDWRRRGIEAALGLVGLLGTVGCGSAKPVVVEAEAPVQVEARGASAVRGEIGGMNEDAVSATFAKLQEPIFACIADGATRVKELGGHFAISLRVDEEGKARWAYLSASTLGDQDTERCVLEIARAAEWPRPVGGEGLATRSFDVDAGVAPVLWEADKVRPVVKHLAKNAARCKKGKDGRFVATAYVRPDGRVKSAGVVPPSAAEQEVADCVAAQLEKLRVKSPGRRAAKLTFEM